MYVLLAETNGDVQVVTSVKETVTWNSFDCGAGGVNMLEDERGLLAIILTHYFVDYWLYIHKYNVQYAAVGCTCRILTYYLSISA